MPDTPNTPTDEKLERLVGQDGRRGVAFNCPGCGEYHVAQITGPPGAPIWVFNGDYVLPTLSPSLLVRSHYAAGAPKVCHLFIRDGQIEFLGDCTHTLAGQTVPLSPVEAAREDESADGEPDV